MNTCFSTLTPLIAEYFTTTFRDTTVLYPAEARLIANSIETRRIQFSTGRYCARQALAQLGVAGQQILRGDARQPLWPAGFVGSISHTADFVGAVAARRDNVAALGVDIERTDGVTPGLWPQLFSDTERRLIDMQEDPHLYATLLFSLKESFYKLQYPLTGTFVDFKDVVISQNVGMLSLSPATGAPDLSAIDFGRLQLHWKQTGGHVVTLVLLPAK